METSPAFLYGESIFTSSRAKNGKLFFRDMHLGRIFFGIEDYYLGKPLSLAQKSQISNKLDDFLSDLNGGTEYRVRLTVFSSPREGIIPSFFSFEELNFICEAKRLNTNSLPVELKTYASPLSGDYPNLKMGSYMPLLRLKLMAKRVGVDDALLVLDGKYVAEATTSNIVFYKGDKLYTPKKKFLDGVIIQALKKDFNLLDREITTSELSEFEGAFLTNSVNIISTVSAIDGVQYKMNIEKIGNIKENLLLRGYDEK